MFVINQRENTMNENIETNYDQTFAFMEILRILSRTEDFRNWLSSYHKINDQRELLDGYKYILSVSLAHFINLLVSYDPFSLKDDEKLVRADFLGVPITDIPNSCEKTIVLKNIWKLGKKIRKASTFDEIQNERPLEPLLRLYDSLLKQHLVRNGKITKEESLSALTQFYVYLMLVDTNHGVPHAARLSSIFESDESPKYLDAVFNGYRYSLEYMWFILLGQTKFQQFCVRNLHRSDEVHFKPEHEPISIDFGEEYEVVTLPESDKERIKREERQLVFNKWQSIDQFFGQIKYEIIRPLEAKIGNMSGLGEGFLKLTRFDKTLLKDFMSNNVEDAPYMLKNDEESAKKRIDSELLWYPISVLNSAKTYSFNGAFAFVAMLRGYIQLLKDEDAEGKILVQIFKHPAHVVDGYDYSFGIRVGAYGIISDGSGWLIFLDCATDYSGAGGHDHRMCMNEIEKFRRQNILDVKEQTIDNIIFKKFLAEKGISLDYEKSRLVYDEMKRSYLQLKGKLLEYLVYKWLGSKNAFKLMYCDHLINSEQIDCFCQSENQIDFFECKLQSHEDVQNVIKQIKRKQAKIQEESNDCVIIPHLVLYSTITNEKKSEFEKEGIMVHQDFKNEIQNDRIFSGTRREIKNLLDSDSSYYNLI